MKCFSWPVRGGVVVDACSWARLLSRDRGVVQFWRGAGRASWWKRVLWVASKQGSEKERTGRS